MIGIALGLAVMILSVAIVIGFKKEVRNKVIGFGTHIQISNFDNNTSYETIPIAFSDTLLQALAANPAIAHVEPFATKPGILKTEQDFQGIVLKGIDEQYDWTFLKKNLKEGDILHFDPNKRSTDVLISKYLSDLLGLKLNDSFLTYFVGEEVRVRKFHISGIYETGFADYDKLFVFADIRQVRRLNGWDDDQVSGIELLVHDYDQLDQTAFRPGNATFVTAIARDARTAQHGVARLLQGAGEGIHRLASARRKSHMRITGARRRRVLLRQPGTGHDFQLPSVAKREEIRAQPGARIVVALVGTRSQQAHEKVPRTFQVSHIQGRVMNT